MTSHPTSQNHARLLTAEGQVGQAYSEAAFRYFLAVEQKRHERSSSPFLLLLVSAKANGQPEKPFSPATASRLFAALGVTLRDTDFTGWYREGYVAGAVLTQLGLAAAADVNGLIIERVSRAIAEGLPPSMREQLEIRLLESAPFEQS